MKKLIVLLLAVLMIFASVPTMSFAGRFDDVSDGKWYSEGISFCAANGYMTGTSESVFDRNAALTRAMFMTILAKVRGVDLAPYENKTYFNDVKRTGWYTAAIGWASLNGLASGIGDGVFGYKNPVTREQMAVFLYAYAEKVNEDYLASVLPEGDPDIAPDPEYTPEESYTAIRNMIAIDGSHRDIGELQSETQEMIKLEDDQYYQSYTSRTHDMRYIFVSRADYEIEAEWDWMPIGTRDEYSLENLGKIEEDQSGLEGIELPIDTTLRADLSVFNDADRVHSWAKDQMSWAVACGLFSGVGEDVLDPRGNCTRAQTAVLVRAFVLEFLSDCEHEWVEPNCIQSGYCRFCDLKSVTELGHDIPAHPCDREQKCTRCAYTVKAKEHKYSIATCTKPAICSVCGHQGEAAKGHNFNLENPTCTTAKTCKTCYYVEKSALGHEYYPPTCTQNGYCARCNYTRPALGHTTNHGYCDRCGVGFFKTIFHYVNYNADMVADLDPPPCYAYIPGYTSKMFPSAAKKHLDPNTEWGWIARHSDSINSSYISYGSYYNGEKIEAGFKLTPGSVWSDGTICYYFYAYRYNDNNVKKTCAADGYVKANLFTAESTVEFDSYYTFGGEKYEEEFKKLVAQHLKKALRFANGRFKVKDMGITVKDLGFVNFE